MKTLTLFLFISFNIFPQIDFEKYFLDKSLRIDYFHTGNDSVDNYSLDELIEEPFWGGSKKNLIDKFNYGNYKVLVYPEDSDTLIYSRTYSSLFNEWQTTDEAKRITRTFTETVVIPYPKQKVRVELYNRDRKYNLIKKFEIVVDPSDYFIKKERIAEYNTLEILKNGEPSEKVDVVIIPDGYTNEQMEMFKNDIEKFAGYLFNSSPFRENKEKFNIWGVEAPSEEEGTDIPGKNIWKKTVLNSSFYTFDIERYLMTTDNKSVRSIAANAPYDQIYILVNSDKYGGGSIYNYYSVCVNKNPLEEYVFVHEFGHGFASLADEYYTSDVAYENYYPLDVEPLDPNLTTLVDFESKWKNLVDKSTPVPTPAEPEYKNVVGAFEGGGYVEKNIYRPMLDCTMKSATKDNFCPVCKNALQEMIDFYSE